MRLVLDFDGRYIGMEEASQAVFSVQKNDVSGGAAPATEAEQKAVAEAEAIVQGTRPPRPTFTPTKALGFTTNKAQPGKALEPNIKFLTVETEHQDKAVGVSRARYLYFARRPASARRSRPASALRASGRLHDGVDPAAHRQGQPPQGALGDEAPARRHRGVRTGGSGAVMATHVHLTMGPRAAPNLGPSGARRGFTLLEIMVAVAILGLGLTAIPFAQAGVPRARARAPPQPGDGPCAARCSRSRRIFSATVPGRRRRGRRSVLRRRRVRADALRLARRGAPRPTPEYGQMDPTSASIRRRSVRSLADATGGAK